MVMFNQNLLKRQTMTTIRKGYDPDLGKKVAQESMGYVIGLGRSSRRKSEEQVKQEWIEEHGQIPDAQQLHDAMMAVSVPNTDRLWR
jgi:hypothetical protein